MQRTALLALHEWLEDERADGGRRSRDPAEMKLLEVACGTGRLHTFIKDNYPAMQVGVGAPVKFAPLLSALDRAPCAHRFAPAPINSSLTSLNPRQPRSKTTRDPQQTVASDLSPFYLAAARDNVAYWKRARQPAADLGPGPDRAGVTFAQCAAEAVPAADGEFDVVVCVYLFHEMPEEVRGQDRERGLLAGRSCWGRGARLAVWGWRCGGLRVPFHEMPEEVRGEDRERAGGKLLFERGEDGQGRRVCIEAAHFEQ